jgi:hypothetical protein
MFIILTIVMLSGLFIYVLLSPPKPQERFARIARGAPVNEPNYELSIMGLPEPDRSQE